MEGFLIYSIAREKEPSFRKEIDFLLSSARASGVALTALSFAEAERYIYASYLDCAFLYFYDEDAYLMNLAMSLGIPCFGHPYSSTYCQDLGLFYKKMEDYGIAHPSFYNFPNLKNERPSLFFAFLSQSIEKAGIRYPFYLRKKNDEGFAPKLCLSPVEFNGVLKKTKDSAWVVEEYLEGPILFALAIGKRCFGVLEEKNGKLVPSSFDNAFVRAQAVKIASLLRGDCLLVSFKYVDGRPLAHGVYPGKYFRVFAANFANQPGEALFARLKKEQKRFNPYFYVGTREIKKNRNGARLAGSIHPHDNRD